MERTPLNERDLMFGHTSEETAFVVDDYPYGRRIRTQIRYWIETTKHGDRMCSQTLNPKTGRWNKPKKSTYSPVGFLFREPDTGYIRWVGLRIHADADTLAEWMPVVKEHGTSLQRAQFAHIAALSKVYAKVTWTVSEGKQTEEEAAEQDRIKRTIGRAVAVETHRTLGELT